MATLATITRRTFLVTSAAIAGGVVFGIYKYKQAYPNPLLDDVVEGETAITPYVKIDAKGVTIIVPRAEMGQGVHTTLAAMVAEELDVDLAAVNIEHGPASKAYFNNGVMEEAVPFPPTDHSYTAETMRAGMVAMGKFMGMQITGGSSSTIDAFEKMRIAGAAARQVLIAAAAAKLGVNKSSLNTQGGWVVSNDGQKLAYTELAGLAAEFEPPSQLELKPQSEWQLLAKSLPRTDMLSKCTGAAEFGIDTAQAGMLFATIKMNPFIYQKMRTFDASEAEKMPGVKKVIPILDQGVAVVATNTWYAFKAAEKIKFDWGSPNYPENSEGLEQLTDAAFAPEYQDGQPRNDGDALAVLAESGEQVIRVEYQAPLLAHAAMEPLNATALCTGDSLEIWAGNQSPTFALAAAAKVTGLAESQIKIHTPFMGGGFGRRAEMDFVKYAAAVAQAMPGAPVKVTWTREEDMTHDCYRPLAKARMQGVIENNRVKALDLQLAAPSIIESQFGRVDMSMPGPDATIVQAAWEQPYAIDNYRVTGYRVPAHVPVSSWRSVGASQNAFFQESMLDELFHVNGQHPLQARLAMISDQVSAKVLTAAAELAGWGTRPLPDNHAMGVAFCMSFGVPVAQIVEVQNDNGRIKLVNAYIAADVGQALDPRNVEAQLVSGFIFGATAAMSGEITVKDGKVEQTNFHNYPVMRLYQTPNFKVKVLENGEKMRGIGEPGTPPAAPALGNAIFALTGKRIRRLPFNREMDFV